MSRQPLPTTPMSLHFRKGLRRLDPAELRTVNSGLLDITARTTQTSFPTESTVPDFRSRIRPLDDHDPRLPALEDRLAVALGGDDRYGPLGMCWPTAAAAHVDAAKSFHTNNVGGFGPLGLDADLDVADLTERFARIPAFGRVSELKQARLIPCADAHGEELMTRPIPMDRWIAFETTIDDRTYRLHQGRWYEIGQNAVELMRAGLAEPPANKSSEPGVMAEPPDPLSFRVTAARP